MATKLNSFAVVHSFRATVIQTQRWKRDYEMLSHAGALSKFRHCILVFTQRIQTCGLRAKVGGCHRLRRRANEPQPRVGEQRLRLSASRKSQRATTGMFRPIQVTA
jgi:hypothetical protein